MYIIKLFYFGCAKNKCFLKTVLCQLEVFFYFFPESISKTPFRLSPLTQTSAVLTTGWPRWACTSRGRRCSAVRLRPRSSWWRERSRRATPWDTSPGAPGRRCSRASLAYLIWSKTPALVSKWQRFNTVVASKNFSFF